MKPWRCPSCQTIIAHKASPVQLIVPDDAECGQDMDGVWWIECRCGRFVWWRGSVARQMPRAA